MDTTVMNKEGHAKQDEGSLELLQLNDLQLALIGGGIGDVVGH